MSNKKNPKTLKDTFDKTTGDIEGQDQIKESPKDETEIDELSEDVEPSSFTENVEDSAYGSETKGSEEIDDSLVDERFSKSESIDESEFRKSKKMRLEQETDSPSDE